MITPIERIKGLIHYLPEKDIPYAERFISTRDFESLSEIINSDIIKIEKNSKSGKPKSFYKDLDLEKLETLKAEVDSYLTLLDIDEFSNEELDNLKLEEDY